MTSSIFALSPKFSSIAPLASIKRYSAEKTGQAHDIKDKIGLFQKFAVVVVVGLYGGLMRTVENDISSMREYLLARIGDGESRPSSLQVIIVVSERNNRNGASLSGTNTAGTNTTCDKYQRNQWLDVS